MPNTKMIVQNMKQWDYVLNTRLFRFEFWFILPDFVRKNNFKLKILETENPRNSNMKSKKRKEEKERSDVTEIPTHTRTSSSRMWKKSSVMMADMTKKNFLPFSVSSQTHLNLYCTYHIFNKTSTTTMKFSLLTTAALFSTASGFGVTVSSCLRSKV